MRGACQRGAAKRDDVGALADGGKTPIDAILPSLLRAMMMAALMTMRPPPRAVIWRIASTHGGGYDTTQL